MKLNIITALIFSLFFISCEKDSKSDEPAIEYQPYHSENWEDVSFFINGEEWNVCGAFLSIESTKIVYNYYEDDPNYGKLFLVGNRLDECNPNLGYDHDSSIGIFLKEGALKKEKGITLDLKDKSICERLRYSDSGNDPNNNLEHFANRYDNIIDGQIVVDSVFNADPEKEWFGKVWCSFWVDLALSEQDLEQGEAPDTVRIRNGKISLTTWW